MIPNSGRMKIIQWRKYVFHTKLKTKLSATFEMLTQIGNVRILHFPDSRSEKNMKRCSYNNETYLNLLGSSNKLENEI